MIRQAVVLAVVVGGLVNLSAQAPSDGSEPAFEVASVKPNKSGDRIGPYFRYEGLQVVVVNNNLFTIMRGAWGAPARPDCRWT